MPILYFSMMHIEEKMLNVMVKKKFWPSPKKCPGETFSKVSVENILGFFYGLLLGLAISSVVFITEKLYHKQKLKGPD